MQARWKRTTLQSAGVALAVSLGLYLLAWGLATTHEELNMQPGTPRDLALWSLPAVFLLSLIFLAARGAGARKP